MPYLNLCNKTDDVSDGEEEDTPAVDIKSRMYFSDLIPWYSYFQIGDYQHTEPYLLKKEAEAHLRKMQAELEQNKEESCRRNFDSAAKTLVELIKSQKEITSSLPWGYPISFGLQEFPSMGTGVVALKGIPKLLLRLNKQRFNSNDNFTEGPGHHGNFNSNASQIF
jgi:hypothetical protein